MCSIIVLRNVREDYPLVLATNRDEFYARPSTGPARLLDAPRAVGGRDLLARGTWMGVTEHGLFVGVTNLRTATGPDRSKRSRGELVVHALSLGRPEPILRWLSGLNASLYNGFNLLFGTAEAAYVAYGREAPGVELVAIPDGVHLLPNDRLDAPDFWKVRRAQQQLVPHVVEPWEQLRLRLQRTLSDTTLPALDELPDPEPEARYDKAFLQRLAALCVRTPVYGTRSSTVVALRAGAVSHFDYADGPPDQTPFVSVLGLLSDPAPEPDPGASA